MLDRLQSLNLIAWVREPAAIHVTVAEDAGGLRLDRRIACLRWAPRPS